MKNKQEKSVVVLAGAEMFDYLKEKVGERKTRTEAYSDLLDKSLTGFVSPFLKKQEYELQPYQCHVTISDLATEWHWHRATVRSFLETLETFGQLKRTKLVKSIVITMNVQSDRHPWKPPLYGKSLTLPCNCKRRCPIGLLAKRPLMKPAKYADR